MRLLAWCLLLSIPATRAAEAEAVVTDWPDIPEQNGSAEIPAQEWPLRPGPRTIRILIHYPGGLRNQVRPDTGIMLTLHNWGGSDCIGTASPEVLSEKLNVVAVCVNYLQSGRYDSIEAPEPYDCGYLQALDALRALWYVRDQLSSLGIAFDDRRLYCTGGSGGGNVALMSAKLAPRTFACVVDVCGMKKLSDDIAFHLPGGSDLNARWNRTAGSSNFLSVDDQEIRFVAHPGHLAEIKRRGSRTRILVIHGVDDRTCPFEDAVEMVDLMEQAGLSIEAHWITKDRVDGKVFTNTGHSLGDRTQMVLQTAGHLLAADSPDLCRRDGPSDFELRSEIRFASTGGQFVISYAEGYPVGRFEPRASVVDYPDHDDPEYWLDDERHRHPVRTLDDWQIRRRHVLEHFQRVAGPLPGPVSRVPLQVEVLEEVRLDPPLVSRPLIRRKLTWQSDGNDRVPAYLLIPIGPDDADTAVPGKKRAESSVARFPAMLCLQQTTEAGKDEPAGIRGDPSLKYALELAERGFVTLAPDYPSFGEHAYDFAPLRGYQSGSMKAVWDNIRAVDLLQTVPEVDADRIGCIGHSLGGHNAIFTSLFEPRIRAVVVSCGFTAMTHDDLPSWTGPRYFPRIASVFENRLDRLPFDFHELLSVLAPRPVFISAARKDSDFSADGVQQVILAAQKIYRLHTADAALHVVYPEALHSFPDDIRLQAYQFLEQTLQAR